MEQRAADSAGTMVDTTETAVEISSQPTMPEAETETSTPSLKMLRRGTRALTAKATADDAVTARIQATNVTKAPSPTTTCAISTGEAPIARSTPISRLRSRTLRLVAVVRPRLPTEASTPATISRNT